MQLLSTDINYVIRWRCRTQHTYGQRVVYIESWRRWSQYPNLHSVYLKSWMTWRPFWPTHGCCRPRAPACSSSPKSRGWRWQWSFDFWRYRQKRGQVDENSSRPRMMCIIMLSRPESCKFTLRIQSNSVITNSSGPDKFVRYNQGSL